jgi:hypothetical protein
MNEKNLNFKNNLGFELYLEGKKVGFSSITISEVERAFPTATITFPATSKLFYILPATLVQVFGPSPEEGSVSPILLFEGEVSSISYVKAESGTRQVSFSCTSLLAQ